MIWVYRLLFLPALIVLAPGYLLRMRRRGGYGADFAQRFGGHPRLPAKDGARPRVWLQAVSVGEVLAIGPIVEALRGAGAEVYLTTTTSTGRRLAEERYRGSVLGIGYFPIDWWPFTVRAWRRIAPDMVILAEGERWPEILRQAARRGVPVLNINARISDRSFARMERWPAAARLTLRGITRLLCVSAEDAVRFERLGALAGSVVTTGNIKLDVTIPRLGEEERARLRAELGLPTGRLVVLGASTWPGEEEVLLGALGRARAAGLECSLLIVPRHAERRGEIERMLSATTWRWHLRSRGAAAGEVDVTVADTTGELRRLAQIADVVFVGKSLTPHTDGQTPVEAAALEKPILFGPGMGNFRSIARELRERGAAREVAGAAELGAAIEELLREPAGRAELAAEAGRWHRDNVGAVERTRAIVIEELERLKKR